MQPPSHGNCCRALAVSNRIGKGSKCLSKTDRPAPRPGSFRYARALIASHCVSVDARGVWPARSLEVDSLLSSLDTSQVHVLHAASLRCPERQMLRHTTCQSPQPCVGTGRRLSGLLMWHRSLMSAEVATTSNLRAGRDNLPSYTSLFQVRAFSPLQPVCAALESLGN